MKQATYQRLTSALVGPASAGLESTDPRFGEITDLVSQQQFAVVADRVDALVGDGVVDIRLVAFALYDTFLVHGIDGLLQVCDVLRALTGENLPAIGPQARRDLHVDRSITWLLKTVSDRLEYHASKQDAVWESYQRSGVARCEAAEKRLGELGDSLARAGFGGAAESSANLLRWLRELLSSARAVVESEEERATVDAGHCAAVAAAPLSERTPATRQHGGVVMDSEPIVLRGSYHLRELIFKLSAFERLVTKGRFDRAAVLCDELQAQMDNFDPRLYLPELFSTFGRLQAEYIMQLETQRQQRDTTRWRAYQQFYHVDPVGFVEAE